jgi:hypothetical protein
MIWVPTDLGIRPSALRADKAAGGIARGADRVPDTLGHALSDAAALGHAAHHPSTANPVKSF